jgi:hypothetical protein
VFTRPEPDYSAQMVNGGFPKRARHGFERVDAAAIPFLRKISINRKFTPNPISRIFHKFSTI